MLIGLKVGSLFRLMSRGGLLAAIIGNLFALRRNQSQLCYRQNTTVRFPGHTLLKFITLMMFTHALVYQFVILSI